MNLKNKILLSTTFFISIFLFILIFFWQYNTQKLETVQKIRISEFQSTFNEVLALKSNPYKVLNYDYSYWDELVNFTTTKDLKWAKINLEEPMLVNKLDYSIVYDNHKHLLFYKQSNNNIPDLRKKLPLSTIDAKSALFSNYFLFENGKLIQIFTAPIQPSIDYKRKSSPQGYYIIGKIWDNSYIADLSKVTKQNIELAHRSQRYDILFPLNSYDKTHIAHLGIRLNSKTTEIVNYLFKNQLYLIFVMGLVFIFIFGKILFKIIIQPLKEISNTINCKERNKLSKFLLRKDEIGEVARAVNDYFIQIERIEKQLTDHLTGLPNRQQLTEDLEESGDKLLILINIKKFRSINESYGYDVGDTLLQLFAKRLTDILEKQEKCYRVSSDEFAILSHEIEENKMQIKQENIVQYIENSPFIIGEIRLNINILMAFARGENNLRRMCDIALCYAKEKHMSFIDFNNNSNIMYELQKSKEVTKIIQNAISKKYIKPFGQKIVNTRDNSYYIETLMRIVDDSGEVTLPSFFLEQSKTAGLYTSLSMQMLENVFEYFRHNTQRFSINITYEDMLSTEVSSLFFDLIHQYRMHERIIIELVESEKIDSSNEVISKFIQKAKSVGCMISIDDFGSGYSNFNYLVNLKANFIKIDGSLIRNIDTDENAYLTVKSIVSLAKELNIKVVAEFVHTETIFNIVKSLEIELLQGYYLHQPEAIEKII
jgi:diguanylate cyclase (GGDEF)-like protein